MKKENNKNSKKKIISFSTLEVRKKVDIALIELAEKLDRTQTYVMESIIVSALFPESKRAKLWHLQLELIKKGINHNDDSLKQDDSLLQLLQKNKSNDKIKDD